MNCISCKADIPPAWVTCIQKNECPGCGGIIMTEASKSLLDELREAMKQMPNDPEGLAGWLMSNYQLHKVGAAEPVNFHRQNQNSKVAPEKFVHPHAPSHLPATNEVNRILKNQGIINEEGIRIKTDNPIQQMIQQKNASVAAQPSASDIVSMLNQGLPEDLPSYTNPTPSYASGAPDLTYSPGPNFEGMNASGLAIPLAPGMTAAPLSPSELRELMSGVDAYSEVPEEVEARRLASLKKQKTGLWDGGSMQGQGRFARIKDGS